MSLLDDRILNSLAPAIGRKLVGVSYCCLKHEATAGDIGDPEFYLGGEVLLRFEPEYSVWVTWDENAGWSQHFSVCARTTDMFELGALECFAADSVNLWKPLIGCVLQGFEVLGQSHTPQIIRLSFDGGPVLLGVGYQGRFGDGDDVFARPDTPPHWDGKEEVMWSSSADMSRERLLRISVYALAVAMGALMSVLVAAHWLAMLSGWSAGLLGGAFGLLGAGMRENIGEALIVSLVSAVLLAVFILQVSGLWLLKGVILSIAVGLCAGKLLGSVWKEVWDF